MVDTRMEAARKIARRLRHLYRPPEPDKKFRVPRLFSNAELRKFGRFVEGDVINVSGWTDDDKEGSRYQSYFPNASSYTISNFNDAKGLQNFDNEIFLDLVAPLPDALMGRFDLVFNHTTLEHIFEVNEAFANLCRMSRNAVIVVVPYIQQVHGAGYADYWRFTPMALRLMYQANGLKLQYCSANGADTASIYLFAVGYRDDRWDDFVPARFDLALDESLPLHAHGYCNVIGGHVIK